MTRSRRYRREAIIPAIPNKFNSMLAKHHPVTDATAPRGAFLTSSPNEMCRGFHDLFAEEEERRRIKTLIAPIQHGQQDNDSKDDPNLE